jgi:CRISPR system Cascade subunit CasB
MSEPHVSRPSSSLIAYLYGLADKRDESRAELAALRRGLGERPGTAVGMYRYIAPRVPEWAEGWAHDAHYLIAALFALHPLPWPEPRGTWETNFGGSFARLAALTESASIERRFTALLDAHRDDLGEHLRHAVSLLKAHDVPVDWAQLLTHIISWDDEDRRVQRHWARTFWSARGPDASAVAQDADPAPLAP